MKRIVNTLALTLVLITIGCDDCNDCKELVTKSILVLDENGNNLLFGPNAIYNPQVATLTTNSETQLLLINEEAQTLDFFLEDAITSYTLQLDENTMDTITFDLAERESKRCCGTQTFATATRVNGSENTSTDTIIIVK